MINLQNNFLHYIFYFYLSIFIFYKINSFNFNFKFYRYFDISIFKFINKKLEKIMNFFDNIFLIDEDIYT